MAADPRGRMLADTALSETQLAAKRRWPRAGRCTMCGPQKNASSHMSILGPLHTWKHLDHAGLDILATDLGTTRSAGRVDDSRPFAFPFGCHKGCSLSEVLEDDPTYIDWILDNPSIFTQHPRVKTALVEAGYINTSIGGDGWERGPRASQRRPSPDRGRIQEHHCRLCGASDHKFPTCDKFNLEELRDALVRLRTPTQRAEASARYSGMPAKDFGSQRSAYKSRSFVEYCQANARRQVEMAYEDGLLRPNAGMPCFCSGCDGLLGPLCGDPDDFELHSRNVYNRCGKCRTQFLPTRGHHLFSRCGHGSLSASFDFQCHWLKAHCVSADLAGRILGKPHSTVQERYDMGAGVIYYDALRRQSSITFGELPAGGVTVLEADEKLFKASVVTLADGNGEGEWKEEDIRVAVSKFVRSEAHEYVFPSTLTKSQTVRSQGVGGR